MKKYLTLLTVGLLVTTPLALAADNAANTGQNTSITDRVQNSDIVIKTKIVTAYTLNSQLNPFDIKVTVDNSNVNLTGSVQDAGEKDLAEEIAKGVDGVGTVTNNIMVEKSTKRSNKPTFTQTVDDATTTAAVKSKLLMNSNTSGLDIHVKTVNGIVTLTGAVKSKTEKELAGKLTANTDGVLKVKNNLTVKQDIKDCHLRLPGGNNKAE